MITRSSMSPAQAHKSSIIDPLAADLPGKYFKDRLYQRPKKKKRFKLMKVRKSNRYVHEDIPKQMDKPDIQQRKKSAEN